MIVTEKKQKPSDRLEVIGVKAICDHVAGGESLLSWCKLNGFAYMTVLDWIDADAGRAGNYARARESRADVTFEMLDDVSDAAVIAETAIEIAGLRLKADNIKWKLARMASKYGDKQTIDLNAQVVTMTDEQRKSRLAELLDKAEGILPPSIAPK